MKKLLNLDGAQTLSKNEQKTINGGIQCLDVCNNPGTQSDHNLCKCACHPTPEVCR